MLLSFVTLLGFTAIGDRLIERPLDDVAVIAVPARVGEAMLSGVRTDDADRLAFAFGSTYRWESLGSGPAYRHLLFVSLMAPDASDADYARLPAAFGRRYDATRRLPDTALGSGTLTVIAGIYRQNTLQAPARTYVYRDRGRRLQITWHAVDEDLDADRARRLLENMASSFRLVGDPSAAFAELRDRPRRETEERADRRRLARDTLASAGFVDLVPGEPQWKDGVLVEWMDQPEPRFQFVKPLGLVHAAPGTQDAMRPRTVPGMTADGSVGWREAWEGGWRFHNHDDAYLPFPGVAAALAGQQADPDTLLFYYSVTVRVEEASPNRIASLGGFYLELAEVERAWREGRLIRGRIRSAPFPLPAE
jgi:hypothetical protein